MSRIDNKIVTDFEPTLTKQSFKDECNINNIVAKYQRTGQVTHLNSVKPRYLDCVGVADYQHALDIVNAAGAEFDGLPAKLRARFANDPAKLIAFCDDPQNYDEAVKLGLVAAPETAVQTVSEEPKNQSTQTPEQASASMV